uniref:two component sensor kinase n=1 Tax=Rhodaphanes brevistipitata TaxID=446136 RepID=UPI001FCDCFB9|nr:two component sensor kinase [Rhodaphanes brevistipitata]UNJ18402.1 two component sensor kinase [Rhodaphanes brevistipitata]
MKDILNNKNQLQLLIQNLACGVILLDNQFNILLTNTSANHILNWHDLDATGKNILDFSIKDTLIQPLTDILTYSHATTKKIELVLDTPHLNAKSIIIYLKSIYNHPPDNKLEYITITLYEIDREKEILHVKNQFIRNVSHELRTPLTNIQSFLETLIEFYDELSSQEKIEFLCIANKETLRLSRLVNNVLNLSKLDANYTYKFETVNLSLLLKQVFRSYQLNSLEKDISLSVEVHGHYSMLGNYDLLFQAFSNLIDNSLKFNKKFGEVIVRIYSYSNKILNNTIFAQYSFAKFIRIEISDTGCGITSPQKKMILDKLSNLYNNSSFSLKEIGVGLPTVQSILKQHDSQINFRSEIAIGSTFWFDFKI